ncbi:2EXR family [Microdochium nivale]|nr:2EXR family [Microdochium nivale]
MTPDHPPTVVSFPQFALLPAELRLRIWRFAAPRRTVPVRLKQDLDAWNWASNLDWWMHYNVVSDNNNPHKQQHDAAAPDYNKIPAVLLVNTEARGELIKQYREPLRINRELVKWLSLRPWEGPLATVGLAANLGLGQPQQPASESFDRMCDAPSVKPFHPEFDVLEWAETWRWHRDATTNTTPLFLGACLSVRHVSLEYAVWMSQPLGTLARMITEKRSDISLQTITVTVNQPRKRRQSQFRLARKPRAGKLTPSASPAKDSWEQQIQNVKSAVEENGAALFQSTLADEYSYQTFDPSEFAVFQVIRSAELTDDAAAYDRLRQLAWKSASQFAAPYWEEAARSDPMQDDAMPKKQLDSDLAVWCEKLKAHAVDPFSRTLPAAAVLTIPCHGICTPEHGLPGTAAEPWTSQCLRETDWDKVWDRRGAPSASAL